MNKSDLINAVAHATGLNKANSEEAVKATLEAISKELENEGTVTLIGFGTFSVMQRSAREGKNPQTGATIHINAKKVPKFKPGKALSDAVNK